MLSFPCSLISLPVTPSCQCWCTWTACTRSLSWRSHTSSRPYPKSSPTIPRYLRMYVYHCTYMCSMHKCNYVHTYVCIYMVHIVHVVQMWQGVYVHMHVQYVCMHVCLCACVYTCIRVCECGEYACKKYIRIRTLSTTSFARVLRHYVGLQPK